jgi:hypothetical protein
MPHMINRAERKHLLHVVAGNVHRQRLDEFNQIRTQRRLAIQQEARNPDLYRRVFNETRERFDFLKRYLGRN